MTLVNATTAAQQHSLSFLSERDIHFAGQSCKTLQKAASANDLWRPFLAKRSIEPTENNKQRLTAFFKTCCDTFAASFKERMSLVKAQLESQKHDQFTMDDTHPLQDVIILSRARFNEIQSNFIDIYDLCAAIFKSSIQSPEFIASLNFHGITRGSADADRIRFLCELGVNPSKPLEGLFALDMLLENRNCSLETIKLLIDAKADFSNNRTVAINGVRYVKGTIDTAASYCTPAVFRFLW